MIGKEIKEVNQLKYLLRIFFTKQT